MIFIINGQKFKGETAVEIIRAMENASFGDGRQSEERTIHDYLVCSLEGLADRIPPRELDVSPDLDDETISFDFLCLLDSFQIGTLYDLSDSAFDASGE